MQQTTKQRRGFTLVEVIVVLVILVILMAISIPMLMGYIEQAKEKQELADAQRCVVAAQTIASEGYAEGEADGDIEKKIINVTAMKKLVGAKIVGESVVDPHKKIGLAGVKVVNGKVLCLQMWTSSFQEKGYLQYFTGDPFVDNLGRSIHHERGFDYSQDYISLV